MQNSINVRTITEVMTSANPNTFVITSYADLVDGEANDTGYIPSIYKADLLTETKIVDGIEGQEGELILSHTVDSEGGEVNEDGEFTIQPSDVDDVDKYEKSEENLIYNE